MTELVPGVSNMILYSVQFNKELDDNVVAGVARRAVERPGAYLTTEQIYAGIVGALESDETLTDFIPGHAEQDYRDFLARVARRLDALRPWPQRPFQPVDPSSWGDLDGGRLIARIKLDTFDLEERLRQHFGRAGDGREAFALRLKSGAEVALAAQWWSASKDTALLLGDPRSPGVGVVQEFCDATGITRDEITIVEQA